MESESYWKVAGGVLLGGLAGIGAVTLLPVFGGAMAITGVGVAVGSVLGGGAGGGVALMSDGEQSATMAKAQEQARNEVKAGQASIREALMAQVKFHQHQAGQRDHFDDLTLALFGVGLASLTHCRVATEDNVLGLKEFAFGMAHQQLPAPMLEAIADIENGRPTLAGTFARAHAVAPQCPELFRQMVELTAGFADADGKRGLVAIWTQLRAA